MWTLALTSLLALQSPDAPAPASARDKLLVLDVKSADLSEDQLSTLTQSVAARAHRFSQVETTSSADVRELASLEAEKQAAGCDGDSCLSELAGALGARWVLSTRAGKIGAATVVSVQLYDARDGSVKARDTAEAYTLDDVLPRLSALVDGVLTAALGEPVAGAAPLPQAPPKTEGPDPLRMGLQIGGGSALALGLVAGTLGVIPFALYQRSKGELLDRQRKFDGSQEALEAAAQVRQDAVDMRGLYNGAGRFALFGGVALTLLGGGALVAGVLLPPLDELTNAEASK